MTVSKSAVAGIDPVEPAAITGVVGGASVHSIACPLSKAFRLAAGSSAPSSARMVGQSPISISRNCMTSCQCSEYLSSSFISVRSADGSQSSVAKRSISFASSSASAVACSGCILCSGIAITARLNITLRFRLGIAGGRSLARSAPAGTPASAIASSSSSMSPKGVMRGSKTVPPSLKRKNASLKARQARRVGNKMRISASASGSPFV